MSKLSVWDVHCCLWRTLRTVSLTICKSEFDLSATGASVLLSVIHPTPVSLGFTFTANLVICVWAMIELWIALQKLHASWTNHTFFASASLAIDCLSLKHPSIASSLVLLSFTQQHLFVMVLVDNLLVLCNPSCKEPTNVANLDIPCLGQWHTHASTMNTTAPD